MRWIGLNFVEEGGKMGLSFIVFSKIYVEVLKCLYERGGVCVCCVM